MTLTQVHEQYRQVTRGVLLIAALGFCKAHYSTNPYFIHFNRLMCSPLTETWFTVLKSRLRKQISILFWAHPVDTEQWHCQEHFGANIGVCRDCFSVK